MDGETLPELRRMSRLLALVAVKGLDPNEAAPLLNRAGYTHVEVGKLLGLSANAVEIKVRRGKGKAKLVPKGKKGKKAGGKKAKSRARR